MSTEEQNVMNEKAPTPDPVAAVEPVVATGETEKSPKADPSAFTDPVSVSEEPPPGEDGVLSRSFVERLERSKSKQEAPPVEETKSEEAPPVEEKKHEAIPEVIPEAFLDRVTELEKELTTLRQERENNAAKNEAEKEAARRHLLLDSYKMKSEAYLAVADVELSGVDPRTPEGQEKFAQWAASRAELFENTPKIPTLNEGKNEHKKGNLKRGKSWADIFNR